jgi:hypothetical protein
MGKRRPEDYEQDHRIYTGLYTAKAFNMLKDMLPSVVEEWGSVVPIRDVNGETVLVTRSNKWERSSADSCRKWMLDNIQSSFSYALGNVAANAEERFVLSRFLIRGENSLTDEQKKILEKLRGVPRDVITSELNVCLAEEEARIEKEYAAFAGQLDSLERFSSVGTWFGGQTYNMPRPTTPTGSGIPRPDFYPADMMKRVVEAEAECVEVFNMFAKSSHEYAKAQAKYRSILVDAKKLNTKIKNDRIKALRREFAAAKRTSK